MRLPSQQTPSIEFFLDGGLYYFQLTFFAYLLISISICSLTFELWLVKKAISNEEIKRKSVYTNRMAPAIIIIIVLSVVAFIA